MIALRFLLLEDNPLDADVIQVTLTDGGIDCELLRVETRTEFISALETDEFDLILADYALPSFDGISALEITLNLRPDIPFIFVTASLGEELAIETLKSGATDYVLKQRLGRLVPSVQRAWREAQERHQLKRSEAALRESEYRYRTLFETIDEGFCICEMLFDENGKPMDSRFLEINPAFEQMTGLKQVVGRTMRELVPILEDFWVEVCGKVVLTSEPVRIENQSAAMNRWFDIKAFRIGKPQEHKFAVLFTNITDRKRAEAATRDANARFRNMADSSPVLIWQTDETGVMYVNRHYLEFFAQTLDGVKGMGWANFLHPNDAAAYVGAYRVAFARQERYEFQCRFLRHDGEYRWLQNVGEPHFGLDNTFVGFVGCSVDVTDIKAAEAELQASEERFRNMADNAPMMVWVTDATGHCTYLSRSWYDFTGQTEATGLGVGWLDATHPGDRAASEAIFLAANDRARAFQLEYRLRHRDGYYRTCIDAAKPWVLADGEFKGYIGSVIDIHDRKRAEEAVRQSEARLAAEASALVRLNEASSRLWRRLSLSEGLNEILVATIELLGADMGNIQLLDADRGVLRIAAQHGFQQDFLNFFREVSTADDSACGRTLRFGKRTIIEDVEADVPYAPLRPVARAAGYRAVQSTPLVGRDGAPLGMLSTHWRAVHRPSEQDLRRLDLYVRQAADFIDHIRAEATLRQSEERYRTLFESIDEGFCIVEVLCDESDTPIDYRLLEINPVFEQQTGIRQAVGKTARQLNLEDHWIEIYGRVAVTGKPVRFENGSSVLNRWFDVYACRTGEPEDRKVAIVFKDITDRKRTEQEREQLLAREQAARESAESANRIKDEFLAVLSHELRSPLNPILGWSKLLQKGKLDAAKTANALATIERNAQLQSQLIEDLLDISRILRGKLSLNQIPVDLRMVISSALETVRLAAQAKSLQIQTTLSPDIGAAIGDAGRLQQVIWNLLSNAVKFTPHGGQITVVLAQSGTNAQIQVIDTGIGIKPDFLPYVFEHFRQEDGTTTRKFGGLGLGLAIARQIVELHGGTVAVESQGKGQGATFIVQIPLAPRTSELPALEQSATTTGDLSGIPILVVDDEPDSRDFIAFVLEQAGAIVTSTSSGIEALQAIERSIPHLIVSDIGMPQMDGYMLMQQIRTRSPASQVPAIALTAYAGEFDRASALQVGFQSHLAKPVEPAEIVTTVARLCGRETDA
ncbi:PAS domain S-box protein [Chroococcidiopsis sp. FACHB-1243]|uniref:PAS domain S-box protein n=1 Tax=Chroococcidiopsis sp. [FACHB-1243] TaxID=2692781 RepID=UPI001781C7CE|nr:PAS domain S-box protein [Chroococcidiopsis sp. [FACHB-1243]]MBD2308978.1 PAS domain S-box protein [Chroococcidiopsis sp. [FACHB-1243]]